MKKEVLLMMALSGLSLNAAAQSGSFEQYIYIGANRPAYIVPVAGFTTTNNLHVEARYNYEEMNSASVYIGKTFEKKALVSYTISTMAGAVGGKFKGGSAGANIILNYRHWSFSSQPQYTFSIENKAANFSYSLSDLTYQLKHWLCAGASLQQTSKYNTSGIFEKGIVIMAEYKKISLPLYIFNPLTAQRYFVLGLTVEWNK